MGIPHIVCTSEFFDDVGAGPALPLSPCLPHNRPPEQSRRFRTMKDLNNRLKYTIQCRVESVLREAVHMPAWIRFTNLPDLTPLLALSRNAACFVSRV
jgi:hypothetical protein